jgi:uncharacterized protein
VTNLLPLFPLPDVVLFPGVLLPLHIFEPRYRSMVSDALEGDRRIGMVLLKPGWEPLYEKQPPIYSIGCSGAIVHSGRLEDGRYNIVLQGIERVRILDEDHTRSYRRATVEAMPDAPLTEADHDALSRTRTKLEMVLADSSMPDTEFVHTLAQALDLEPLEKQALLERENLYLRAQSLAELIEMNRLLANLPGGSGLAH